MDGIASVRGVGAATRIARRAPVSPPQPVKDQRSVAEIIGTAAITLIRAAVVPSTNASFDVRV